MILQVVIVLILSNQEEWCRKPCQKDSEHKNEPANFDKNEENDIDQRWNIVNHFHEVKELEDNDNSKDWFQYSQQLIVELIQKQTHVDDAIDNDICNIEPSPKILQVCSFNDSHN